MANTLTKDNEAHAKLLRGEHIMLAQKQQSRKMIENILSITNGDKEI